MGTAIELRQISKRFTLSHDQPRSLQELLMRLVDPRRRRRMDEEEFWALKDVSFAIPAGKTVGLIGTNGSGKSTALKMIAGILQPTSGEIVVNGRISALLELGSGMHLELTGRENIFLNGSLLGLSNAEMQRLYPRIVDFSELGRFIDMPVKHYSSGMYMRLAFSVAIHVRPDILLLDEVLAVGDQSFQAKCLDRIYRMRKAGATIVIVSHGLETLEEMCDELVWLQNGEFMAQGPTDKVAKQYRMHLHRQSEAQGSEPQREVLTDENRWGSREVEITDVRLRRGEVPSEAFLTGDPLTIDIDYLAHQRVEDPMFGLAIFHIDGTHICGPNNKLAQLDIPEIEGSGTISFTIPNLPLMPGTYEISVSAYDAQGIHDFDVHWRAYSFHVNPGGTRDLYGLVHIPGDWSHDPAALPLERERPEPSPVS